jgi:hypothetical protein
MIAGSPEKLSMTGRFGLGAAGMGAGVVFLVLLEGAVGVVLAVGALVVLLLPVDVEGAQVIHMHNIIISTRIDDNLLNAFS